MGFVFQLWQMLYNFVSKNLALKQRSLTGVFIFIRSAAVQKILCI
jgi:hypothetical protein